jgi:hypothetical protein
LRELYRAKRDKPPAECPPNLDNSVPGCIIGSPNIDHIKTVYAAASYNRPVMRNKNPNFLKYGAPPSAADAS